MKQIESEEDKGESKENKQNHHSCIINVVIGTLYCEKGNFEFGISRICKSLDPIEKKLAADTWFYTKRCLLALIDYMAKQRLILKRDTFKEIISFLREVHQYGQHIDADFGNDEIKSNTTPSGKMTISQEVLHLKRMLCKLTK